MVDIVDVVEDEHCWHSGLVLPKADIRLVSVNEPEESSWCRPVPRCDPPAFSQPAPGVGLEPTTSRLTAERVCQLSYPGSGYPASSGRGLGRIVCKRNLPMPT